MKLPVLKKNNPTGVIAFFFGHQYTRHTRRLPSEFCRNSLVVYLRSPLGLIQVPSFAKMLFTQERQRINRHEKCDRRIAGSKD